MKTFKIFLFIFILFIGGINIVNAGSGSGSVVVTVTAVPTVTTSTSASITQTGATLGANVTSLGLPASISARGTCWGTTVNPTSNCAAQGATTTGVFTHARTGLSCGTTYYYRGYATNTTGTGYSTSGTFTTSACSSVPTVTTPTSASIAQTTVTLGANVTSLGVPASISARGTCWGTSTNPTTNCTAQGTTTTGVFTQARTGLSCGTTYYYRGYATNTTGTGYSTSGTFTTSACSYTVTGTAGSNGTISPSSRSVNSGATTTFTVTPNSGYTASASGCSGSLSGTTYTTGAITANCTVTASFTASSCTGTPWGTMASGTSKTAYLSATPAGACTSQTRTCTNGTLSGTYTATSCTPGCTGTPWGSVVNGYSNTAYSTSSVTYPSSCTSQTRTCSSGVMSGSYTYTSCSVNPVAPTVTTSSVSSIAQNSAVSGGTIVSNGGATVTVSGIAWSTSSNPTTANSKTTNGWATGGPWSSTMSGLSCGTTYHVRAYATNSKGTSYGSDVAFTSSSCPVNGVCSATHYSCSAGTSTNNVSGSTTWTWSCAGSSGGTTASCSENKPSMTGVITSSPSSCTIAAGASSCNVTITWSTTNPIGTSAVTASGMTNVNGNSGSQSMAVPYNNRTFYLYNNGTELDYVSVPSGCGTNYHWGGSSCVLDTHTVTGTAGSGGTISPASSTVNYGSTTTLTVTPNTGYTASASGCSGSLSGTTYTTGAINTDCTVTATFTLKTYTVTGTAGSGGTISPASRTVNHGSTTTFTVTPNLGYAAAASGCSGSLSGTTYTTGSITGACTVSATFTATGCVNGATNFPTCTICASGYAMSGGVCTLVTVSVTASPTTYNTVPSTNVPFAYTSSTNIGTTECRLLDNASGALTSYATTNPIQYAPPVTPGSYGYYVQCRNATTTTATDTSNLITVNVIAVSVTASPTTYNVAPSSNISFTYTPTANVGGTECRLLDNTSTALTSYQASSPIVRAAPATVGAYGYYVQCRSTSATTATATSTLITANVSITNVAPTLSASTVSSITTTGATLGGTVDSLGVPASISARGTCWGTTSNPTTNCVAQGGTTTGAFTQARTGLTPGTLYHYRAYATNTTGTGYSPDATFTTNTAVASLPTVTTTSPVTNIADTTAIGGGTIVSDGGATVTVSGLVWDTSANPTIGGSEPTLAVGDSYGGGIVGYILQSGDIGYDSARQKGLIVATSDQSLSVYWHASDGGLVGGTSTAIGTGAANTTAILTAYGSENNAAKIAHDYAGGGYTDWYLPSINDLYQLYLNQATIGTVWNANYSRDFWSSSEYSTTQAQYYWFGGGSGYGNKSTTGIKVRAVRSFDIAMGGSGSTTLTTDGWATGGPWSSTMTGLTPDTTYHVRAYATNSVGTSYGADVIFTTTLTGTISASGCTIPEGQSNCNTLISWYANNFATDSIVKTGSTTITSGKTGTDYPYSIPAGIKNFDLWNNGVVIASTSATAVCANTTHWDSTSSTCVLDNPTNLFTSTPSTIFKGKSAVLTWNSPLSISCIGIGFNTSGAVSNLSPGVTVSPLVTTTYTLRCTNGTATTDSTVTTKVITLEIKEN